MSRLVTFASAAGAPQAVGPTTTPLMPIDSFTPEGESEVQGSNTGWETDPDHKWIYGGHPELTMEQKTQLRDMLIQEKDAFAYSLAELPGYSGDPGEVHIHMTTGPSGAQLASSVLLRSR